MDAITTKLSEFDADHHINIRMYTAAHSTRLRPRHQKFVNMYVLYWS